jgi:hypothetical protein
VPPRVSLPVAAIKAADAEQITKVFRAVRRIRRADAQ